MINWYPKRFDIMSRKFNTYVVLSTGKLIRGRKVLIHASFLFTGILSVPFYVWQFCTYSVKRIRYDNLISARASSHALHFLKSQRPASADQQTTTFSLSFQYRLSRCFDIALTDFRDSVTGHPPDLLGIRESFHSFFGNLHTAFS